MKYFGIGNCNKYNIYILVAFLSELLINLLFGLNFSNSEKPARIFPFKAKLRNHKLLYNFIRLASMLFGGIVLYFIEKGNKITREDETSIEEYEKMRKFLLNEKGGSINYNLIIIGIIFSFSDILGGFIDLSDLNLWALEMLYIAIISYLIFKNNISRHKKFSIYIMIGFTILDIIENLIPTTKHI